ncbi:PIG-L family deacetylase [Allokutzneria sp. A3M-2-11 16]|uniref:PIG-L deacetylase family protein n=1 Tax=Allokutzneria sp. A3M-2-11 16 TaxID=2962043 RepID=UPI0020B89C4B|nr:PIG-L family deacetylase [Allokutzneria sp. A3M-2-11 16]MCP3804823.1 PIG-L family deacetylase [Allokutzneria sp. A3M-2-11 16]
MVFAPHPDDDLIGCGGMLIKAVRAGWSVRVVYLTNGEAGGTRVRPEELAETRVGEARAAAGSIGVTDLVFLGQPDGTLRQTPDLLVQLINQLRIWRPTTVCAPHRHDAHPDHIATHDVVAQAVASAAGPWFPEAVPQRWQVPTVLAYEVWTPIRHVAYLEDITEVYDDKLQALRMHRSQLSSFSYDDLVGGLATYRGTALGTGRRAEAFEVLRLGGPLITSPGTADR